MSKPVATVAGFFGAAIFCAVMSLTTPVLASSALAAQDLAMFKNCSESASGPIDWSTSTSKCTNSAAYFTDRIRQEPGSGKYLERYMAAFCLANEGLGELGLGNRALFLAHERAAAGYLRNVIASRTTVNHVVYLANQELNEVNTWLSTL